MFRFSYAVKVLCLTSVVDVMSYSLWLIHHFSYGSRVFLHAICVFVLCVSIVMHFKKLFSVVCDVARVACGVQNV